MGARLPYGDRIKHDLQQEARAACIDLDIVAGKNKRVFPIWQQRKLPDGTWTKYVNVFAVDIDHRGRDIGTPVLLNDVPLWSMKEALAWGKDCVSGKRHFAWRGCPAYILDAPQMPPAIVTETHRAPREMGGAIVLPVGRD